MPIEFGNEGGGTSLPWVRHMIEENVWLVNDPEGMDDVRLETNAGEMKHGCLIDIANIQLGWLKISGGRDFIPWPNNDPKAIARPTETQMSFGEEKPAYNRAFQVMMYSPSNFVDGDRPLAPLRVWSSSSAGHRVFVEKLYAAAEQSENFGKQVPVVQIGKAVYTKEYGGPTKVHEFEIVDWMLEASHLLASRALMSVVRMLRFSSSKRPTASRSGSSRMVMRSSAGKCCDWIHVRIRSSRSIID